MGMQTQGQPTGNDARGLTGDDSLLSDQSFFLGGTS